MKSSFSHPLRHLSLVVFGSLILTGCATAPTAVNSAPSSVQSTTESIHMMFAGKNQEAFIKKFAETAKAKDSPKIIAMVDPKTIPPNKKEALNLWLTKEIFPFFEHFSRMHNYKDITNAVLPDGRVGLWHYTYIVDDKEKVIPFRIVVIDTENGPKVVDFIANECVEGRHPFCP